MDGGDKYSVSYLCLCRPLDAHCVTQVFHNIFSKVEHYYAPLFISFVKKHAQFFFLCHASFVALISHNALQMVVGKIRISDRNSVVREM